MDDTFIVNGEVERELVGGGLESEFRICLECEGMIRAAADVVLEQVQEDGIG
jgi:hypothetical protein